jgi:hypothetical protein
LSRNAQKRDKKKIEQPREGKKNGGKKSRIFCDEPRWTFSEKSFFVFLKTPLVTKRPKNALKKIDKK